MEGIPPEDAKEHERQKAGGGIVTGGSDRDTGYNVQNHIFVANSSTATFHSTLGLEVLPTLHTCVYFYRLS